MQAIRSLLKRQKRNLITPKLALVCAYLFEIFVVFCTPSLQAINDTNMGNILFLALVIASGSQVVCTIRACFAKPKTILEKTVFVIAIAPMLLFALINTYLGVALLGALLATLVGSILSLI